MRALQETKQPQDPEEELNPNEPLSQEGIDEQAFELIDNFKYIFSDSGVIKDALASQYIDPQAPHPAERIIKFQEGVSNWTIIYKPNKDGNSQSLFISKHTRFQEVKKTSFIDYTESINITAKLDSYKKKDQRD